MSETTEYVMTGTSESGRHPWRIHRASCKRVNGAPAVDETMALVRIANARPASCCKPRVAELIEDARQAMATLDPVTYLVAHADEPTMPAQDTYRVPAMTAAEPGRGELAGGDVQPLPITARPRTRKTNRHDQRSPLPPREQQPTVAEVIAADYRTCTGTCGLSLPLVKFPTTTKGRRGTECRACRDARRAAAK